jgi:tetratricopeptide (TPR) repeat protein
MNPTLDQLLAGLQGAEGDPAKTALAVADFACAESPELKQALVAAAIPHWFTADTLSALLDEDLRPSAEKLHAAVIALPMVEEYPERQAHAVHDQTRLALRDRLWAEQPERFRELSRRAATAYGNADDTAPDFTLTCEHLYHQLAGQTDAGDEAMDQVAGNWRRRFHVQPLQTLARLLEELLAMKPAPPLLPRGQGLAYQAIADARINHQPASVTVALHKQAESVFRHLTTSDPANTVWQRDLTVTLDNLGDMAMTQGDLNEAFRCYNESKSICEHLASSDPDNASRQRDLSVSLIQLGDLAMERGDLAEAFHYFTQDKEIAERLARSDPLNATMQHDLTVTLEKLGDLAMAREDPNEAAHYFSECMAIRKRLIFIDPTNDEWQCNLSYSLERLGYLAVKKRNYIEALSCFSESRTNLERLVARDSANTDWQRNLHYTYWLIASKILMPQERWAEALELAEKSLEISERLANYDPTNVMWQNDALASQALVQELRAKVKETEGGQDAAVGSLDITIHHPGQRRMPS